MQISLGKQNIVFIFKDSASIYDDIFKPDSLKHHRNLHSVYLSIFGKAGSKYPIYANFNKNASKRFISCKQTHKYIIAITEEYEGIRMSG